ncbi:hypothetical protein AB0A74_01055 [Saccharothrix sp. NPDC042600]|uniref:hypothetical protein n=1 Tax=Saccharothrix TaxID=2071 RepID=UPI0033F860FD|nr:hypothetical protein GCM10017745_49150 [Saccharothrix mutabilis subsp. capreolus]
MNDKTTWARLDFTVHGDRMAIGYEDGMGRVAGHRDDDLSMWHNAEVLFRSGLDDVLWPRAATRHLVALLRDATRRDTHTAARRPIAVLVRPPRGSWSTDWAVLAGRVLSGLGVDADDFVTATEVTHVDRRPVTPPVRVTVTTGAAPDLQRFARHLPPGPGGTTTVDAMSIRAKDPWDEFGRGTDILVTSGFPPPPTFSDPHRAPRLVITTGDHRQARPAPGSSLVVAPNAGVRNAIAEQVLRGLLCDRPLHEALQAARRELRLPESLWHQVRLLTSLPGLDTLRCAETGRPPAVEQ